MITTEAQECSLTELSALSVKAGQPRSLSSRHSSQARNRPEVRSRTASSPDVQARSSATTIRNRTQVRLETRPNRNAYRSDRHRKPTGTERPLLRASAGPGGGSPITRRAVCRSPNVTVAAGGKPASSRKPDIGRQSEYPSNPSRPYRDPAQEGSRLSGLKTRSPVPPRQGRCS